MNGFPPPPPNPPPGAAPELPPPPPPGEALGVGSDRRHTAIKLPAPPLPPLRDSLLLGDEVLPEPPSLPPPFVAQVGLQPPPGPPPPGPPPELKAAKRKKRSTVTVGSLAARLEANVLKRKNNRRSKLPLRRRSGDAPPPPLPGTSPQREEASPGKRPTARARRSIVRRLSKQSTGPPSNNKGKSILVGARDRSRKSRQTVAFTTAPPPPHVAMQSLKMKSHRASTLVRGTVSAGEAAGGGGRAISDRLGISSSPRKVDSLQEPGVSRPARAETEMGTPYPPSPHPSEHPPRANVEGSRKSPEESNPEDGQEGAEEALFPMHIPHHMQALAGGVNSTKSPRTKRSNSTASLKPYDTRRRSSAQPPTNFLALSKGLRPIAEEPSSGRTSTVNRGAERLAPPPPPPTTHNVDIDDWGNSGAIRGGENATPIYARQARKSTVGEPPVVRSRGTKGTAQKRKSVPPPIPPLGTADAGGEVSAEKSDETVPVVRIRTYEERYNVNTTADSENKPDNTAIEEKVESVERIAKSEAAEKAANDAESSKGNSGHKKAMVAKRGAKGPTQTRVNSFLLGSAYPAVRNGPEIYECMLGDLPDPQSKLSQCNKTVQMDDRGSLLEFTLRRQLPILGGSAEAQMTSSISSLQYLLNPLVRGEQVFLITKDVSSGLWATLSCTFWLSPSLQLLQWTIDTKENVGIIPMRNIVDIIIADQVLDGESYTLEGEDAESLDSSCILQVSITTALNSGVVKISLVMPSRNICECWVSGLTYCQHVVSRLL